MHVVYARPSDITAPISVYTGTDDDIIMVRQSKIEIEKKTTLNTLPEMTTVGNSDFEPRTVCFAW